MTLADIVNHALLRFVRQDAQTRTLATAYARQRYAMIWDAHNWRQALLPLELAVPARASEVALGTGTERVLAVRWAGNAGDAQMLDGLDYGTALRLQPALFDQVGTPAAYLELPLDAAAGAKIRLQQIPEQAGRLLVLTKRRCPGLPLDTSEPLIAGAAAALVAYILGDLWSYEGQESKASVKYQEAGQLIQRALDAEVQASGIRTRLIPYAGIADDINPY